MKQNVYIVGASGFAVEVTEYIENNNMLMDEQVCIKGYFDISESEYQRYTFKAPFLGSERDYQFEEGDGIIIAVADAAVRQKIYRLLKDKGLVFPTLIHQSCFVPRQLTIGEGAILCPFVTITSNAVIGKNFQANIYSYVAHDCTIGDNVTFAPAVKCNGNVTIGDNVYIGTGSIIKQGKNNKPLVIGENAVISAGAYVTKDVPAGMVVFGSPAIEFTKENIKRRS